MVRLNRNKLPKTQLEALCDNLSKTIAKTDSKTAEGLIDNLLGNEEKIMLAKRLAAIILLIEGNSLYKTAKILKISPTTAETIKYKIDAGGYNQLISTLGKNKKKYFSVLQTIDDILHLGGILPHYNGLDRYRGL